MCDSLSFELKFWERENNTGVISVPKRTFNGAVPARPTDIHVMSFYASPFWKETCGIF
jgi:hypothetical protein